MAFTSTSWIVHAIFESKNPHLGFSKCCFSRVRFFPFKPYFGQYLQSYTSSIFLLILIFLIENSSFNQECSFRPLGAFEIPDKNPRAFFGNDLAGNEVPRKSILKQFRSFNVFWRFILPSGPPWQNPLSSDFNRHQAVESIFYTVRN